MQTQIQIGPTKKEIIQKYLKIFAKFPFGTKCKIVSRTLAQTAKLQRISFMNRIKSIKLPEITDQMEVDLTEYAYWNGGDANHLSDDEIAAFNENGYTQPFKVIDRDKALELNKIISKKVNGGNIVYGAFPDMDPAEREKKIAQIGLRDDLESRSWNRHFNIPEIYDLLSKAEITGRLASLFGRDVYLWRSQLFPVQAGGKGTALHQVTDFRFAMNKTVLSADEDVPRSLVNLTVWVALADVDETNAAMILLKGSHKNNRFEQYARNPRLVLTHMSLLDRLLVFFVRNAANDAHARFDLANIGIDAIAKLDPQALNKADCRTLKMKAGEAIIFTSRTIHGSHGNQTEVERLAIGGRYTTSNVKVYPDPGEYREINHFQPLEPVILDKYKKTFKVYSFDE